MSKQEKVDISGRPVYTGEYKDGFRHGKGACYDNADGRVFVGEFERDKLKAGTMSYLEGANKRRRVNEVYTDQQEAENWWS